MSDRGRDLNPGARIWLKVGCRTLAPVESVRPPRSLREARVGIVSTGGARLPGQKPFETGKLGDPSWRPVSLDTDPGRLLWEHPHYDTSLAAEDPDVVFPLRLLRELASDGTIGSLAPTAASMMGYAPLTKPVVETTAPEIGELLQGEDVDVVLLCPA